MPSHPDDRFQPGRNGRRPIVEGNETIDRVRVSNGTARGWTGLPDMMPVVIAFVPMFGDVVDHE
jgi:hypothetical protein